ncbi:response regulator [Phytomonospora endophytica]|uniref:DNA-binding NarL/FixJ family response regulator n=1 Tax=Phytomonospora endophytica TaxID=714109 RepID=A0A841FHI5_9ACTN|nr:response regulator transcription factor [Phytomonospora endophytica]MBB6035195.1 DNA-binding NarL/FixJ family response regulator [Phytomonospora endophytica]GIG64056.1 DNA-binding response regulator [Phytomonospora endophytica]
MIRILLADDELMIRAGVKAILATDPGIEVVAEAGDGREAVELARAHRPDIALLDVRMPRLDGLAAAAEMRKAVPDTKVVMLTTFGEDAYIARALAEGAAGFLLKSGDPRELLAGTHAVAEGGAFLSPQIAKRVISRVGPERLERTERALELVAALTDRERDVLALIGRGLPNAEIARRLFLVEGTVKAHVSAILGKVNAPNRVRAAIIAYEAGMAGEDD